MELSHQDFRYFQQFLAETCGIVLADNKQYLVKNRLSGILAKFGINTLAELTETLRKDFSSNAKLKMEVIEAMTTNETFWFRDEGHFFELKHSVLPTLTHKQEIKIWSAACSSGQEPYSISMCLDDYLKQESKILNVKIVGTDISESVLNQARQGIYNDSSISRGIDIASRSRYFYPVSDGYKVNSGIAERVKFQAFNLLKPFASLGQFDVIFCRNVLIYFSEEVKQDILKRMANSLCPGGYLFLSSTEQIPADLTCYKSIRGSRSRYYQKQ